MTAGKYQQHAFVLGTTSGQVDLIRHLRDRGWYVTGAGHRKQGTGLSFLDAFVNVDLKKPDTVLEVTQDRNVDLVCSSGSDLGVATATRVNEQLGQVPPHTTDTIALCNRKDRLRHRLNVHGLSPVAYRTVTCEPELQNWTTYPAVVKPPDRHGQRGVYVVRNEREAMHDLPQSLEHSGTEHAIIEEFLDGPEYSVNAVVRDGTVQWLVPTRRILHKEHRGISAGHIIDPSILSNQRDALRTLVDGLAEVLHVKHGPLYIQLRDTDQGLRVLEVAPRLDGCHIWRLIRAATGVDLVDVKIDWLTGEQSTGWTASVESSYHTQHLFAEPDAVMHHDQYTIPEEAIYHEFYYQEGESVRRVNGTSERVGYYLREGTP